MPDDGLSPWPVRLVVFAVLVVIALLSIRIIDRHVMLRMDGAENAPSTTKPDTAIP